MTNHSVPIVGAHFRPPAKAIIAQLPTGCSLTLVREPDNQYDTQAIAVFVETKNIPGCAEGQAIFDHQEFQDTLLGFGSSIEALREQEAWHLGYVASKPPKGQDYTALAPDISPLLDAGYAIENAKLSFSMSGLPVVVFDITPARAIEEEAANPEMGDEK